MLAFRFRFLCDSKHLELSQKSRAASLSSPLSLRFCRSVKLRPPTAAIAILKTIDQRNGRFVTPVILRTGLRCNSFKALRDFGAKKRERRQTTERRGVHREGRDEKKKAERERRGIRIRTKTKHEFCRRSWGRASQKEREREEDNTLSAVRMQVKQVSKARLRHHILVGLERKKLLGQRGRQEY